MTALRQASAPAWVETSTRLFTRSRMSKRQFLSDQPAQRLPDHVCRHCVRRHEPIGDVVGHIAGGIPRLRPVALARVAEIKSQGPVLRREITLGPVESPVIAPQPTQEDEWVAVAASSS